MDDILILAPTRWKLRRAVKTLNQGLEDLKLEKHPDKTFIGRIDKGFDILGYHFSPRGLRVAAITREKFAARWHRLYEQKKTHPERDALLGDYATRWLRWTQAGLAPLRVGPPMPVAHHSLVRDGRGQAPMACPAR